MKEPLKSPEHFRRLPGLLCGGHSQNQLCSDAIHPILMSSTAVTIAEAAADAIASKARVMSYHKRVSKK